MGVIVNMIHEYQERGLILNTEDIRTSLVPIHARMCQATLFSHDHDACEVYPEDVKVCKMIFKGCWIGESSWFQRKSRMFELLLHNLTSQNH